MQAIRLSHQTQKLLLALSFGLVIFSIFTRAWISDDALITLVHVANAVLGNGATFNVLERVQGYTHPLWFVLMFAANLIYFDPIIWAFALSFALSIALVILLVKSGGSALQTALVLLILSSMPVFVDWSTSGLENPLAGFLLASIIYILFSLEPSDPTATSQYKLKFYLIFFLMALIPLVRMDLALIVGPLAVYLFWMAYRNKHMLVRELFFAVLVAGIPMVLWFSFSIAYYGSPIPNTALAKLNVDIPRLEVVARGVQYYFVTAWRQPLFFVVAIVSMASVLADMRITGKLFLILGVALYGLYIVYIGGDFMEGRFFYVFAVICAFILASNTCNKLEYNTLLLIALLSSIFLVGSPWLNGPKADFDFEQYPLVLDTLEIQGGVIDERSLYVAKGLGFWSLTAPTEDSRTPIQHLHTTLLQRSKTDAQYVQSALSTCYVGQRGVLFGSHTHIIDTCALVDPTLARLPYKSDGFYWRPGHFNRPAPQGYKEALLYGNANRFLEGNDEFKALFEAHHLPVRQAHEGPRQEVAASFGPFRISEFRLPASTSFQVCDSVVVKSIWETAEPLQDGVQYTMTLKLINIAQIDAKASIDRELSFPPYEYENWVVSQPYLDIRALEIPCDIEDGTYALAVGMYSVTPVYSRRGREISVDYRVNKYTVDAEDVSRTLIGEFFILGEISVSNSETP